MDEAGRVCKVCPRDGTGPEKKLNREEPKVLAPLTIIPTTLVQPLPDPGLIETPLQELCSDSVDDESDSEVIITFQPGYPRARVPSPSMPPEPPSSNISNVPLVEASEVRPSTHADTVTTIATSTLHERPKRTTAGQHSNPFNLPRSVNYTTATMTIGPSGPQVAHSSVIDPLFRPWCQCD